MGAANFLTLIMPAGGATRAIEAFHTEGIRATATRAACSDEAFLCERTPHHMILSVCHDSAQPGNKVVLIPYPPYSWLPWNWRGDSVLFKQARATLMYWAVRSSWERQECGREYSAISSDPARSLGKQFALEQLKLAVQETEQQYESRGYFNEDFVKEVLVVALSLSAYDFAERGLRVWCKGTWQYSPRSAWAIPSQDIPRWLQRKLELLERWHPAYSESLTLDPLRREVPYRPYLGLALERRYDEAFAVSEPDRGLEEIAEIQALLGDFDEALQSVRSRVVEWRRTGILVVLALETFRRGQIDRTRYLLQELEVRNVQMWDRLHLALGFAGRMPWLGYPFPDY